MFVTFHIAHRITRYALLLALAIWFTACSSSGPDPAGAFQRGVDYFKEGKYAKAAAHFEQALAHAPATASALNFLAVCQMYQGDTNTAVANFEKALQLEPDLVAARFNIAMAKFEAGDHGSAIVQLRQVGHSSDPPAYTDYFLGLAYLEVGAWAQAKDALTKHLRGQPESAEILNALGVVLARLRETEAATDHFARAIAADPSFAAAHLNLALLEERLAGNKRQAAVHYQTYLDLEPKTDRRVAIEAALKSLAVPETRVAQAKPAPPLAPVKPIEPEPASLIVKTTAGSKVETSITPPAPPRTPEIPVVVATEPIAEPVAEPVAPATPTRRVAVTTSKLVAGNRSKASAHFNQGVQQHQQRNFDAAIASYQQAIDADATFAAAYYNLAITYRALGEQDKAFDYYERALQANPDYIDARFNYAVLLQEKGYLVDAIQQFEQLLVKNPNDDAGHLSLAGLYARDRATLPQARRHYQAYLRLKQNSPLAREIRQWLDRNR